MINLKRFVAGSLVAAVMATSMVPAFAANAFTYTAEANKLHQMGLMEGVSDTTFDPALHLSLDRQTGIVMLMRLIGKADEAAAMTDAEANEAIAKFTDKNDIAEWAKKAVAYAVKNGLVAGMSADTVAPRYNLSGKMYATLILRNLGYTVNANDYNHAAALLAEKGGLTATEAIKFNNKDLIRDDLVGIAFGSLKAVDSEGKKVIEKLIAEGVVAEAKAVAAGVYTAPVVTPTPTPTPVPFGVESVTSNNLKTAVVNFNRELDKDTINITNVRVSSGATVADAKLSTDKKSVIVILDTAVAQSTEIEITVKDVKDTAGNKLDETKRKISLTDTAVPEILSVVVVDAKHIDVMVSEPINHAYPSSNTVLNDIKIDGNSIIATTSFDYVENKFQIKLANKMNAGTHEIEIAKLRDFANIMAVTKKFSFDVAEDTAAPVMVKGTFKSASVIEVEFNEKLDATGSFRVEGSTPTTVSYDGKKVTLSGNFNLGIGAIVQIKVEYKDQTDVVGNKVSDWTTYTFRVEDDTTLPGVSVSVGDNNKLTFTFTKSMSTTAGKIVVKDKDGVTKETLNQPWTFKPDSNSKVLELTKDQVTTLNDINAGNYTLVLEDFADATVRANKMPKAELAITARDTKKPTVTATYLTKADGSDSKKDTITFYFSEAMDQATVTSLSNYFSVNANNAFSAITDVKLKEFASDGKSVTFFYPGAGAWSGAGHTINVYAVKDIAGNVVDTTPTTRNQDTTIALNTASVATGVRATATDKIEVYFDKPVHTADPSAFKVQKNGTDYATFTNYTISNDESRVPGLRYRVTFTLGRAMDTSTGAFTLVVNNNNKVESIFGTKFDASALTGAGAATIVDAIRPTVKDVVAKDNRVVEITVSEIVYAADLNALLTSLVIKDSDNNIIAITDADIDTGKIIEDIVVMDGAAASTYTDGFDKIVLTFKSDRAGKSYNVSFVARSIKDAADNIITEYAGKTVTIK